MRRVPPPRFGAVYPYTGDAEFVGRLDVVVQAFRDVQPLFLFDPHSTRGNSEVAQVRLVAADLLRGNNDVKVDSQPRGRSGEQAIVDVGDHRELVASFQLIQRAGNFREDRPVWQGLPETRQLGLSAAEAEFSPDQRHYIAQDSTVLQEGLRALHLGLQIREESQDFGPGLASSRATLRTSATRRRDACLPIDQRPVAIEADPFKPFEIEHEFSIGEEVGPTLGVS